MKNKIPGIFKKTWFSLMLSLLSIGGLTACSGVNAAVSDSADTEQRTEAEPEIQTEAITEEAEASLDLNHLLLRLRTLYRIDFTFAMNIPDEYVVSGDIVKTDDYSENSSEEYPSDTEPCTSAEASRRLLPPSIPKPETTLFTFHDPSPGSETSDRGETGETPYLENTRDDAESSSRKATTSEWVLRTIRDYRELRELPLPQLPPTIDRLEAALTRTLADYSGVWSVYIKNLTTGDEILINDSALKSASVMKLFIMGTVYEAIESDELERTQEVIDLLYNMIIYSSNSDANQLLYLLGNGSYIDGIEQVNRYISEQGYSALTHEYNGFDDPSAYGDPSHFNQISAKDCGELLERIYRRTFASRKVCNEIEEMMLSQNTRYKIPSGIPEEAQVGNKTGEMDTVENDVSIVYGEKSDYILCILSNDWDSKDDAISHISELSSTIYRFFDNEAYYRSSSNY